MLSLMFSSISFRQADGVILGDKMLACFLYEVSDTHEQMVVCGFYQSLDRIESAVRKTSGHQKFQGVTYKIDTIKSR